MKKTCLAAAERVSREGESYAFTVEGGLTVEEVTPKVGGVLLEIVLINSGASYNLIEHSTWNSMKQNRIECKLIQIVGHEIICVWTEGTA